MKKNSDFIIFSDITFLICCIGNYHICSEVSCPRRKLCLGHIIEHPALGLVLSNAFSHLKPASRVG